MKKLLIGLIFGIGLTMSAGTLANTGMIGKAIQGTFPLVIDGQKASKEVIVVDGTSYLPVRDAGTMFGYHVDFQNGTVILNNSLTVEPLPAEEEGVEEGEELDFDTLLEREIRRLDFNLGRLRADLMMYNGMADSLEIKETLTKEERQKIEEYRKEASEIEPQLSELRQKLDFLESETSENLSNEAKIILMQTEIEAKESIINTLESRQKNNEYERDINKLQNEITNLEVKINELQASE